MGAAGQDLGRVGGIAAAIPGQEAARGVSVHGVEFFAQQFAADGQGLFGIAEGGEERAVKAHFSGDLTHHLHQAPGEAASVSLGRGDLVICEEMRDVLAKNAGS